MVEALKSMSESGQCRRPVETSRQKSVKRALTLHQTDKQDEAEANDRILWLGDSTKGSDRCVQVFMYAHTRARAQREKEREISLVHKSHYDYLLCGIYCKQILFFSVR